jgi:type IX secretion system PorP/SprF family membrane protein
MFNQLTVNPGYAGSSEMMNVLLGNRQQWFGGFEVETGKGDESESWAPNTTVFGVDTKMNILGWDSGIGFTVMNDQIGAFTNLYLSAVYSRRWETDYGKLGVGLSLGMVNQAIKGEMLSVEPVSYGGNNLNVSDLFGKQPFGDETLTDEEGTALDLGIGAYLDHEDYYLGFSVAHINKPKPKFKNLYKSWIDRVVFVSGGYRIPMKKRPIVLIPSIFIKTNLSSYQVDWNINGILKDKYWGGISYRMQDAIVLLGGVELNNGLRIGYSYDVSVSKLGDAKGGSHEIMLGYRFDLSLEKRKKKYKSVRYL